MKNGKAFNPSPKRPKKHKSRRAKASSKSSKDDLSSSHGSHSESTSDSASSRHDVSYRKGKENVDVEAAEPALQIGSPPKRVADEMQGDDSLETPPKHKKWKVSVDEGSDGDWEQWEPPAPVKTKKGAVA